MKHTGLVILTVVVAFAYVLASRELLLRRVQPRTVYRVFRFYFHLTMPFLFILSLNWDWRLALMCLIVWVIGLMVTPFYIRVERHAERAESIKLAKSGNEPIIYLRSFGAASAMRRIEKLLEESANNFEGSEKSGFRLNPIALGDDDRSGFPKFTTPDTDWWQLFEELTAKSAAIFLLPITAHAARDAGIMREITHVFMRHLEKLIVIVPDAETWQTLAGSDETFDARSKWDEVRDIMRDIIRREHPSLTLPEYLPAGFIFYIADSNNSRAYRLPLSSDNVKLALSVVTHGRQIESLKEQQKFEEEFEALNGISYSEYEQKFFQSERIEGYADDWSTIKVDDDWFRMK